MSEALPPPDPSLFRALRKGDLYELATPVRLARIYPTEGPHRVSWLQSRTAGPLPTGRFDHHEDGNTRGIWYGAASRTVTGRRVDALLGAVAEACADTHTIDRSVNARHQCCARRLGLFGCCAWTRHNSALIITSLEVSPALPPCQLDRWRLRAHTHGLHSACAAAQRAARSGKEVLMNTRTLAVAALIIAVLLLLFLVILPRI